MKVSEMIVFVLNKKIGAGQLQMDEVLQKTGMNWNQHSIFVFRQVILGVDFKKT